MAAIEGTGGASRGRKPKREQHIGKASTSRPARKPTAPASTRSATKRSSPKPKQKVAHPRVGVRLAGPTPMRANPANVGLNAYRGYADSVAHLRANPTGGGLGVANPFNGVNLNPFDYLNRGLAGLGDVLRKNPADALIDAVGNRINEVTRR